jgi:transposase InsO family protein
MSRSWLQGIMAGASPLPSEFPQAPTLPAGTSVVLPIEGDREPVDDERLRLRLRVLRTREEHPEWTWEELAKATGTTPRACRYYCNRAAGREGRRAHRGDAAVIPGRDADGMRAPEEFLEAVKDVYSSPRAPKVVNVWRNRRIKELKRELGLRISYWALRRHIRNVLDKDQEVLERRGGRPVLSAPAFAGDPDWIHKVLAPMQCVQVDYERFDAFINNDEGTGSFRPYLLAAVDVATRCVVAWVLCATEPREADYRKLLHMMFAPKEELRTRLGLTLDYPCFGIPQVILADRGWIFTAHDSRRLLTEMLGIRVEHAAEFQPTMKAIIERLFGTINDRFVHRLPGSVRP